MRSKLPQGSSAEDSEEGDPILGGDEDSPAVRRTTKKKREGVREHPGYSRLRSAALCIMCATSVVLLAALVGVVAGWASSEEAAVKHLTAVEQDEEAMLEKVHKELLTERKRETKMQTQLNALAKGSSNPLEVSEIAASDPTTPLLQFETATLRTQILATRAMLEKYYGGKGVLESTAVLAPTDPRYEKGLDFVAEKMARAMVWGGNFVVAAMGSSVAAGHDNCNYDSYERQLERNWAPLWKVRVNDLFYLCD